MREVPENIANSIKISVVDLLKPKDEVKTAEVTGKNSIVIHSTC